MSKSHPNRLHSFWPSQSSTGEGPGMPDVKLLTAKLEPLFDNVAEAIAEHPRASLSLAAALGVTLGWLIKRN